MFCKHCGAKMEENAKFCPSCGEKVAEAEYTAPKPFEKNSVDSSQNYQYQTSTFKGKQFSTGTSGHVSFGGKQKKSFLRKVFGLIVFVVVVVFVYTLFFADNNPIYNVSTSTSIDSATYEAIDVTSLFSTTTPEIFVTFSVRNYEIGTVISAAWTYIDADILIDSSYITVQFDEQNAYMSLTKPTGDWPVGNYKVDLFADGEYVRTVNFVVE